MILRSTGEYYRNRVTSPGRGTSSQWRATGRRLAANEDLEYQSNDKAFLRCQEQAFQGQETLKHIKYKPKLPFNFIFCFNWLARDPVPGTATLKRQNGLL